MRKVLTIMMLAAAGPAQGQMSLHPGDGFEVCPHTAFANVSLTSWNGTFAAFPDVGSAPRRLTVPSNGQLAYAFSVPQAIYNRQFRVQPDAGVVGEAVISISQCPGAYPQQPAECTSAVAPAPTLDWTTDPAGTGCLLQPGQAYYVSITYGSATAAGSGEPWCAAPGACSVSLESTAR